MELAKRVTDFIKVHRCKNVEKTPKTSKRDKNKMFVTVKTLPVLCPTRMSNT